MQLTANPGYILVVLVHLSVKCSKLCIVRHVSWAGYSFGLIWVFVHLEPYLSTHWTDLIHS